MNTQDLQYVVGDLRENEVATIRFFGSVTSERTSRFNEEFDYLENVVKPSKIRVLINSEGGSVLYGMSTYSTIVNSKIDTECIIEGLAASMASIIWAAGRQSLMRDYGILMIHNPMLPTDGDLTEDMNEVVMAFTHQIETIYRKRFGLKASLVREIMKGEAGKDGTVFDAQGAVQAGIIPQENVISTSKQLCDKVHNQLAKTTDLTCIQKYMTKVSNEIKLFTHSTTILKEKERKMTNENTQTFEFGAVAASLGMKDKDVKDVMARISELVALEPKYDEVQKSLSDAQTVIAGKDATISNLQKELQTATSDLQAYRQKEADEKNAHIEDVIDAAIKQGKIDAKTKAQWVEMAQANLKLAEQTLASIPPREKISEKIASDPKNIEQLVDATKTAADMMAEKVNEVVGSDFKFKKLS